MWLRKRPAEQPPGLGLDVLIQSPVVDFVSLSRLHGQQSWATVDRGPPRGGADSHSSVKLTSFAFRLKSIMDIEAIEAAETAAGSLACCGVLCV